MARPDLATSYQRAYAGKRLGYGKKPALILVDFVRAYFDRDSELYAGAEAALDSALRLRVAARQKRVPVVLTNVVYHRHAIDGGRFFQKAKPLRYFVAGSPMGAWAPSLQPEDDELVVSKQYPSAFFGTSLASTLTTWGVDTLLVSGVTTSGCVRATVVDGCSHGFIPIVVRQACGDLHQAPHEANLFDMDAKYADVVGENEAISYLQGLAS